MNKYKKLATNTGILTLGQLGSKILVFLLVPIYTSVLTTEEYGYYDLIVATVSLLLPIFTLNVAVSSQRFSLDKDANHSAIATISFKFVIIANLIACSLLFLNCLLGLSKVLSTFSYFFLAVFFSDSINTVLTAITIGREKVKELSLSGVISTFTCILLNVLLLIVVELGLTGYFLAYIIANVVQIVYLVHVLKFDIHLFNNTNYQDYQKKMLAYSCPQIANNVSWWINNALDRYIVTAFCGVAVNGIYSVAYKIPTIMNVISGIFSQAWGLSAIKNFSREDEDSFFSNTYKVFNFILVVFCSILIIFNKLLASFLFANDFYEAWQYVPFLVISSIFGALSGFLGSFFSAIKNGKLFAKSTVIGAVINSILNLILVYCIGAIGAAVATELSYFAIWLMRLRDACKFVNLRISYSKDLLTYAILNIQAVVMHFVSHISLLYTVEILLLIAILLIYYEQLRFMKNIVIRWFVNYFSGVS
ncbi:polysaccharide biosynthesis C-terminal domain-containing protein [uncultured Anaerovibrio sp.]|uniref:lipopolysaccharide biosynthesis protein n=1 Tax=uncultured Anaerovibrio sp. TaxID=361586 RepID=UPI0025CF1135|nr:polysaccharide biosynthesis C-terminal domain-containing protein [uncultured Anaerovibrio sp.]